MRRTARLPMAAALAALLCAPATRAVAADANDAHGSGASNDTNGANGTNGSNGANDDRDWVRRQRERGALDDGRGRGGGPPATAGTPNNGLPDLGGEDAKARAQALSAQGAMVSVQLGFGTANADGLGIGARGGYTMKNRVWLGGVTEYNFGRSNTAADIQTSTSRFIIGPEIGYALNAGPVVVRPYVSAGLGVLGNSVKSVGTSVQPLDQSENTAKFYVMPGAAVQVPIQNFFVGGDARVLVMKNEDTSVGLFGSAGFRL